MQSFNRVIAAGLMASASILVLSVSSQAGEPTGPIEAPRGASVEGFSPNDAKPIENPKLEDEDSRAAAITDPNKIAEGMTALTRSANGEETRSAPSDALKELVTKELAKPQEAPKASTGEKAVDPAFETEGNRQVFGNDDRVQISNTKQYPFTTIGFIQAKSKGGSGSCSGTLIGPRTVLTAAHCLYSHEDGGWLQDILFAPGLNGMEDVPFGAWPAESVTILEGYVKNYQGYYGSVVPWDLGIITLQAPIGEKLGYMEFANFDNLGDFSANIVGYPGDKPAGTMWRATCDVMVESIGFEVFQYDCDTYPGSSGSSVYAISGKSRVVTGVNVAESKNANTAVRLNAPYVEWIKANWK